MFELPKLPFARDALSPVMSADTLDTHHGKHHAAYVKKTNALLIEASRAPSSLEDVVRQSAREKNTALFNQSAQAWNHGFFWQSLTPDAQGAPEGALAKAVEKSFGGAAKFREAFLKQGEAHFASGWIWLRLEGESLRLETLPNAGTPLAEAGPPPVLVCDLWEHAYYLDYKNDRAAFLKGFFDKLANWEFAGRQYEAALAGAPGWTYPAPTPQWAQAS
ncbi:MAG TPA: superoxide dismutase [Caulobacterales bacterium]|nr:superoxide dismutase [Caulobacterales bacterium]